MGVGGDFIEGLDGSLKTFSRLLELF